MYLYAAGNLSFRSYSIFTCNEWYSDPRLVSMINSGKENVALPTNRAFVLQFRRDGDNGNRYAGRIEHIESGRVEYFYSTEEMCAKLKAILSQKKPDPGE